jgi:hypothetical protein
MSVVAGVFALSRTLDDRDEYVAIQHRMEDV